MSDIKNLAAALVAAQSEMPMVGKSGNNTFDKYTYAKLEDYVRVIRPIFTKHGLAMLTSVDQAESLEARQTKSGGSEYPVRVRLTLTILHSSGEFVVVSAWGEGQDRADKGIYKAITGARKYALASALGLATSDDSEELTPSAPPAAQRQTATKPKGDDGKAALIAAVREWVGCKPEDTVAVVRDIMAKLDIKSTPMTSSDVAKCAAFVESNKSKPFAEAIK